MKEKSVFFFPFSVCVVVVSLLRSRSRHMWVGVGLVLTSSPNRRDPIFFFSWVDFFICIQFLSGLATSSTWFSVSISTISYCFLWIFTMWMIISFVTCNFHLFFDWRILFWIFIDCPILNLLLLRAMSWQLSNRLFTFASVTTTTSFSCNSPPHDCIIIVRRSSDWWLDCRSVLLLVGQRDDRHKQTMANIGRATVWLRKQNQKFSNMKTNKKSFFFWSCLFNKKKKELFLLLVF